ncbi:MAG: hypothetical protein U0531_03140 [Dehalococcoidia bacterium]
MAALALACIGGVYLDGWAHTHGEWTSFFTQWHGILYGSVTVVAGFLGAFIAQGQAAGYPLTRALPRGYGLSMIGVLLFGVGGLADMVWHIALGIEVDVEQLISPSHLGVAAVLIVGGAAAGRLGRPGPARRTGG